MAAHHSRVRSRGFLVAAVAVFASLLGISCDKMPLVAPTGTAITLVASTNDLPVNGTADITAILVQGVQSGSGTTSGVTAGGGTAVHNGTVVTFSTTLGRIEPAEAQTYAGKAVVKLIGDGRSGKATITAFSGAATKTLDVNVGSASANRIIITASPQNLPVEGGTASISARVEDAQGNGLLGVPVSFTATKGTLSQSSALSNDQGFAIVQLTTNVDSVVSASSGSIKATDLTVTLRPRTTLTITASGQLFVSTPASLDVTATSSAGGTPIVNNLVVDYGDGTKSPPVTISGKQTYQHLFARKGSLTVTATGTDPDGGTVTGIAQVVVGGISADGSASPSPATVNATVTFKITTGPAGLIIDHYEFDFGDGNSTVSTSPQATHQFGSAGFRTVAVKVVPIVGDSVTVLIPIAIN